MKEIQSFSIARVNNATHFMFASNMAERAEKDAAQVQALRNAVTAED